jgi:two-component system, cell cycle sensor histidine kinase and response regulator CckA
VGPALLAALVMLRLGSLKGASLTYLTAMWICAAATSFLNGGIRSPGLVLFVALPISAAWLYGYRVALWTTVISMATTLVFVLFEVGGVSLPRLIPGTPFGIWGVLLIAILIGVLPVAQVLRSLRETVEELHQSEERFRLTFFQAAVGIAQTDPDFNWILLNDRFCEIFGYSQTELSGKTFVEITHPEDREASLTAVRRLLSGEISLWSAEKRYIRKDGVVIWGRLFLSIVRDRHHQPQYFIGIVEEITERKQAAAALLQSEERYRSLVMATAAFVWIADVNGEFGRPQPSWESYTGQSWEQHRGSGWIASVHPDDRARVADVWHRAVSTRSLYEVEWRAWHAASGEWRYCQTRGIPVINSEGEAREWIGAVSDVHDRKMLEARLQREEKLASLGVLAGGIAHDFNNLLGGVAAQAELALAELDEGLHPKEELRAIQNAALRGSEIVRQLMVYAGKESGVIGPVNVSQIVKEMIELLSVSVSKHAVLEADLGKDLPSVQTDAAQLRQIVMNLVTNASEAIGDRDGVIRVTTRHPMARDLPGGSETLPDGDYLILEVSDTGQGMPPEIQARVFDPFFTTKSRCRGLGLAVVHGIVQGLGGAIRVTSELGKGTTFRILLPCAETKVEATSDPVLPNEELGTLSKRGAVLIVEDEDALRGAVARMLRKTGFDVIEAADGSSAIDLLRAAVDKIDMVLLDMTIPGASSAEVIAAAARTRPDIRIILTSAYGPEMLTAPLSADQVRGFIRKPFQLRDLVNTLRRAASA